MLVVNNRGDINKNNKTQQPGADIKLWFACMLDH